MAQVFLDQFGIEPVKSGANGSMRRKDVSSPCDIQGKIERLFLIFHVAACPFEHSKSGMTFIEMTYLRVQA